MLQNKDITDLLGPPHHVDRTAINQFLHGYDRQTLHDVCNSDAWANLDIWAFDARAQEWKQLPLSDVEEVLKASKLKKESACRTYFRDRLGLNEEEYRHAKKNLDAITPHSPVGIYFNPQNQRYAMIV